MSDNKSDQEKTEEPTFKKLKEAKEQGNVSKSQELTGVVLLCFASATIYFTGEWMYEITVELFEHFFHYSSDRMENIPTAIAYLGEAFNTAMILMAPVLGVVALSAIAVNLLQTGFIFTTKAIEFKGEKLDPLKGLKRIFSIKGIVELVKGIAKVVVVAVVIWQVLTSEINSFLAFALLPLIDIVQITGSIIYTIIVRILIALIFLSALDAAYQRYEWRKQLKMTKQEIKDEYKQMEGDPQVKGQRRRFAQKILQKKRLDHAVLSADVVVTNPTHYAVALSYKADNDEAPKIMAKGMRKRALKIREYATHYDIPIIENPPLARALYAAAEEDQFIPPELYEAVAELLAYLYKLKEDQKAA
jgi:flagellar biosynthetic protein FlhB